MIGSLHSCAAWVHECVHACMHACVCASMRVSVWVCVCVFLHVCIAVLGPILCIVDFIIFMNIFFPFCFLYFLNPTSAFLNFLKFWLLWTYKHVVYSLTCIISYFCVRETATAKLLILICVTFLAFKAAPEKRVAQKTLAEQVTLLVHGGTVLT